MSFAPRLQAIRASRRAKNFSVGDEKGAFQTELANCSEPVKAQAFLVSGHGTPWEAAVSVAAETASKKPAGSKLLPNARCQVTLDTSPSSNSEVDERPAQQITCPNWCVAGASKH